MAFQSFDYWISQGHYVPLQQQHTALHGVPPEMLEVVSSTYDRSPAPLYQAYDPYIIDVSMQFGTYHSPMTPSEFGLDHGSPYCSPWLMPHAEPVYTPSAAFLTAEKTNTTSGRRQAQNRVAQRVFRERKEKHARDLEVQLTALTDKYNKLEVSHTELNAAYGKLRRTIELLTQDDEDEDGDGDEKTIRRKITSSDTLWKLPEVLHGEKKGRTPVQPEPT